MSRSRQARTFNTPSAGGRPDPRSRRMQDSVGRRRMRGRRRPGKGVGVAVTVAVALAVVAYFILRRLGML